MRKRQYEVGEMQGGLKTAGKGKANAPLYRRQFQLFDDRFNSTKPICYGLINFVTKALGFRGRAGALILEKRE